LGIFFDEGFKLGFGKPAERTGGSAKKVMVYSWSGINHLNSFCVLRQMQEMKNMMLSQILQQDARARRKGKFII